MNHLSIVMSCGENHFYCRPIDINVVFFLLEERPFRIVEHLIFEGNEELNLIDDDSENSSFQVLSEFRLILAEELHLDTFHKTSFMKIEFQGGGHIAYSVGELHINLPDGESVKILAQRVLETYGYFGAQEIWRLIRHNEGLMFDIDHYFFLENQIESQKTVDQFISRNTIAEIEEERNKADNQTDLEIDEYLKKNGWF
jgi:hypothetical protein